LQKLRLESELKAMNGNLLRIPHSILLRWVPGNVLPSLEEGTILYCGELEQEGH
jgi:hypothetical protein